MRYTQATLSLPLFFTFTFATALPALAPVEDLVARDDTNHTAAFNGTAPFNATDIFNGTATFNTTDTFNGTATFNATDILNGTATLKEAISRVNADPATASDGGAVDCNAAKKLADGIDQNIQVQKQEQTDVAAVKDIVNTDSVNSAKFDEAKKKFLTTIQKGIDIRKSNQEIAGTNSPAAAGLAKVADAQAKELSLAQGLKGNKADLDSISQLTSAFAGGIKVNEQNKQDALKGC
ncbi:hypothetical protein LX36DRAFT_748918 [Colletotrichum falcatum]|nr:hypothetical protein LX36DRAFT_748918 [Colletotrichum falcatum]